VGCLQASMLEIYNEEYKDLLIKKKLPDGKQHKVSCCLRQFVTPTGSACCTHCSSTQL